MDRSQQRLELVLIPLDNFCESYGSESSSPNGDKDDHSYKSRLGKTIAPIQVKCFFFSSCHLIINTSHQQLFSVDLQANLIDLGKCK